MSNPGENSELVKRFKNVMDRQPLAGNGADGNFSLHNDWKGWWNKLFMPVATEAAAALAAADARIAELGAGREAAIKLANLSKALLDDANQERETAEAARVKLWNECRELRATIDVGKAVADSAVQDRETAETLLEEARRALAPFIRLADNVFRDGKNATVADEVTLWCFNETDITFGDLRRARATHDRIGK